MLRLFALIVIWFCVSIMSSSPVDARDVLRSDLPKVRPVVANNGWVEGVGERAANRAPIPNVAAVLIDLQTGEVRDALAPQRPMPPASVAKLLSTLYAFAHLGQDYRFTTRIVVDGQVSNGVLNGDLYLLGGGDPALDSDELFELARQVRAAGISTVSGKYFFDASALPSLQQIFAHQPIFAAYNPGLSGLNANFNRVHLVWGGEEGTALLGRAEVRRPQSRVVGLSPAYGMTDIFAHSFTASGEQWQVAAEALTGEGGRWLPVRRTPIYTADLFRTLARDAGIALSAPIAGSAPNTAREVARFERRPLKLVARGMLHFSTNVTAEIIGLTASSTDTRPAGLQASAQRMNAWLGQRYAAANMAMKDHSGLNPDSRVTTNEMAQVIAQATRDGALDGIVRRYFVPDGNGSGQGAPAQVRAKTGSLNFVRGLGGYFELPDQRRFAFAIFSNDLEKRAASDPYEDQPPGTDRFARQARDLEQAILRGWINGL